jgi:hypothetical protein
VNDLRREKLWYEMIHIDNSGFGLMELMKQDLMKLVLLIPQPILLSIEREMKYQGSENCQD